MCCMLNNPKIQDYSFKRKNLENGILTLDKNNNFTITLPKFLKEKRFQQKKLKNYYNKEEFKTQSCPKILKTSKQLNNERYKEESNLLNKNLILSEKEQNELFEKLRTKNDFAKNIKSTNVKKTNKLFNSNSSNLFLTESNLVKVSSKPKFLTPMQREKLSFLGELTLFNDIEKLKEKAKILKHLKEKEKKKPFKLLPIDLFHYDEDRWSKQVEDPSSFDKNEKANTIEKETSQKLNKMKNDVIKIQKTAKECVQTVEETLKEIENKHHPKRQAFRKLTEPENVKRRALTFLPLNPQNFDFEKAFQIAQAEEKKEMVENYEKENENEKKNENENEKDIENENEKDIENENEKDIKKDNENEKDIKNDENIENIE